MSRPAFLDLPFKKELFSDRDELNYSRNSKERNPVITDDEKALLKQQYPNNRGGSSERMGYTVYAARTEYRCSKITDGIFRVQVYAISNRMDTSRPKDTYFLVTKETAK